MSEVARVSEERPFGMATCGFSKEPEISGMESDCGKPGVRHIYMGKPVEFTAVACEEHVTYLLSKDGFLDQHEFGGVCNIPGTLWRFSQPETEGCCHFPIPDEALEAVATLEAQR